MPTRTANITRKTKETDISLDLNLDGGSYSNNTSVGFFDHMLDHIAKQGRLGLTVTARGDTHIDDHHTVEDVGIVLGQAIDQALGDKRGIERYGFASLPMDEALVRVTLDLSGRAALVFDIDTDKVSGAFAGLPAKIGSFDSQLVREFFTAVINNAKMNCHIEVVQGSNDHHVAEAIFKAFGRALRQAVSITGTDIPSTKGSL